MKHTKIVMLILLCIILTVSGCASKTLSNNNSSDKIGDISQPVNQLQTDNLTVNETLSDNMSNTSNITNNTNVINDRVISLDEAAHRSLGNVSMGGGGSSHHSSGSSSSSDVDSSSSTDTSSNTDTSSTDVTQTPDSTIVSAPLCTITNTVVDVAGRGSSGSVINAGDKISYRIAVTNIANFNLTNITITDNVPLKGPKENSLGMGGIWTYNGSYTVTQNDINNGTITNTATVSCDQSEPISSSSVLSVSQNTSVTTEISADKDISKVGDVVTLTATVTNTGNVKLTGLTFASYPIPMTSSGITTLASLDVGQTWTLTGTYTATQADIDNPVPEIVDGIAVVSSQVSSDSTITINIVKQPIPVEPTPVQPTPNQPTTSYQPIMPSDDPRGNSGAMLIGADGHAITLLENQNAVDPTYKQLVNFIKSDETDKVPYNLGTFVCADYAETVHNNAEKAGYKCAYVSIYFQNMNDGHACNLFNTTDKGLVAIDCVRQTNDNTNAIDSDKVVNLVVGQKYSEKFLYQTSLNKNSYWSPLGTTEWFCTFW